jgi:hypothetical protein
MTSVSSPRPETAVAFASWTWGANEIEKWFVTPAPSAIRSW